jgi:hypothetical protein
MLGSGKPTLKGATIALDGAWSVQAKEGGIRLQTEKKKEKIQWLHNWWPFEYCSVP